VSEFHWRFLKDGSRGRCNSIAVVVGFATTPGHRFEAACLELSLPRGHGIDCDFQLRHTSSTLGLALTGSFGEFPGRPAPSLPLGPLSGLLITLGAVIERTPHFDYVLCAEVSKGGEPWAADTGVPVTSGVSDHRHHAAGTGSGPASRGTWVELRAWQGAGDGEFDWGCCRWANRRHASLGFLVRTSSPDSGVGKRWRQSS